MEISFSTSQDAFNLVFGLFLLLPPISYFDLAMVTCPTGFFFRFSSLQYSTILELLFKFSFFLPKKQLPF